MKFGVKSIVAFTALVISAATFNNAKAFLFSAKTEVLGYSLGMSQSEVFEKVQKSGGHCVPINEGQHQTDFLYGTLRCRINAAGKTEILDFSFTNHLDKPLVVRIFFFFESTALSNDVFEEVKRKYPPSKYGNSSRSSEMILRNGDIVHFFDYTDPIYKRTPGPFALLLHSPAIERQDLEEQSRNYRQKNPVRKF